MKRSALQVKWSGVKAFLDSRKISAQYVDIGDSYLVLAIDGPIQLSCYIHKETPASADQTDFETNYLPNANTTYSDSDGSTMSRTKMTQSGWQYHLQGLEFTTSDRDSIINQDENDTPLGFATIKIYDAQDNEITTEAGELTAVKTVGKVQ